MLIDTHGPLADVRVLDASRVLAGPYCGQLLAELGGEVIKIEHPERGDETRSWGPPFAGTLSAYYLSCNHNKRAITLDFSKPEGLSLFHDLVRCSDVVLENFRASSAERLSLTPKKLLEVNPRIIVCSISGFGRTGPLKDLPGYDFAIQALSGLMANTGPVDGPPCKVGVAVADVVTGLNAAVAILACLHARLRSGHGYSIDLALLDCAITSQVNLAQAFLTNGTNPPRQGNAHLQIVPYQLFETADGWLVVAVGNDDQWQRFCDRASRPDLASDPRFATNRLRLEHRGILIPILEVLLKSATNSEWQTRFLAGEVPHAPVWKYPEIFAHPQVAARHLKVEVRDREGNKVDLLGSAFHLEGSQLPPPMLPPDHGQHTDELLSSLLGLKPSRLDELRHRGVI